MTATLHEIARVLGGQVTGGQALCPGPGHSRRDRSMSVRLSPGSPDGFICFSHANDPWQACRDHITKSLGMPADRWRPERKVDPAGEQRRLEVRRQAEDLHRADLERRQVQAVAIWTNARSPRGTPAEACLRSRRLHLTDDLSSYVIRFAASCPWGTGTALVMVAALRDIVSNEVVGIHRTALTADGQKLGRKMLGRASGAAIKLDNDGEVALGLSVGEGLETCVAAQQLGLRPVWALGSVNALEHFPVLAGIEGLTVLAESDDSGASARACDVVGARWHSAGRDVEIIYPRNGGDLNDALR